MPILNPIPILLVIEDPAYNLANSDLFAAISFHRDGSRSLMMNRLRRSQHLAKSLLPSLDVRGSKIEPSALRPPGGQ